MEASLRGRRPAARKPDKIGKISKTRHRRPVPRSVLALREYVRLADEQWKGRKSDGPNFLHDFLGRVAEPVIRERLEALLLEQFPRHVKRTGSAASLGSKNQLLSIKNLGWREARKALYNMKLEQWVD